MNRGAEDQLTKQYKLTKTQAKIDELRAQIKAVGERGKDMEDKKQEVLMYINSAMKEIKLIREIQIVQGIQLTMESLVPTLEEMDNEQKMKK